MSLLMMKSEITVLYRFQIETYKEEDRGEREIEGEIVLETDKHFHLFYCFAGISVVTVSQGIHVIQSLLKLI